MLPCPPGKTTLLNTMAGKIRNGKVTGRVRINGSLDRLERYRKICGFVPQVLLLCCDLLATWLHFMTAPWNTWMSCSFTDALKRLYI
jgi:ABC-type Mn2+/Zn2+ transport system ATPase subunit